MIITKPDTWGSQMRPIVTIGVCVKNCENFVKDAVESVCHQDYPSELMEVIFVDDGSEDKTLSIIGKYVPKMKMKVKVFHHEWMGLGYSRNVVVNSASGDYIIWVDGDMILPSDHVTKQVEFMEKNPQVGIGKAKYGLGRKENVVSLLENIPFMVYDSKNGSLDLKLPGTGGAIYRVNAIRQAGSFDEQLAGVGEDQDAAYRVRQAGWTMGRSPAFFYERRVRTWGNLWRKYFWYGYGDYQLYRKNRNIFSPYKMVPIAGFIAGIMISPGAYHITRRMSVFLLPFHFAFKMAAWCAGFIRNQTDSWIALGVYPKLKERSSSLG